MAAVDEAVPGGVAGDVRAKGFQPPPERQPAATASIAATTNRVVAPRVRFTDLGPVLIALTSQNSQILLHARFVAQQMGQVMVQHPA